jgi:hypothetical protein
MNNVDDNEHRPSSYTIKRSLWNWAWLILFGITPKRLYDNLCSLLNFSDTNIHGEVLICP